jgi:hypothetical protein
MFLELEEVLPVTVPDPVPDDAMFVHDEPVLADEDDCSGERMTIVDKEENPLEDLWNVQRRYPSLALL